MQPGAPESGEADEDAAPTQAIAAGDELRLGKQVPTQDVRKASLLAGTGGKIGRFHVLRLIGEGGMGMVFAAYDEELDRKVAIKLLRGAPGEGSIGRTRLLREAQALARLSHPNVVTVYEVGEYERQVFIAMEFVLGDTLHRWLRKGPRDWREVVAVFIEAGRGLAVAHAAKILHRDFKPANVLLGADGRVRVLDFGLALAQGREEHEAGPVPAATGPRDEALTEVGSILGTPAYMAPERFLEGRTIDARADQFSFCVALHEGLYGARPFTGSEYEVLCAQILGGAIPEAPRGSRVPKWLRKVLLRGLAVEPASRYPDMEALISALQRDPGRVRRRVLIGLGVGAVLVAGGYGLAQATATAPLECPDPRARLGWETKRDAIEAAFVGTQASYAADTWTRISGRLGAYVDRWASVHREACEARARGEQSEAQVDLRMGCLERRRGEFSALLTRLAEADAETVRAAAAAVDDLPSPDRCADTAALKAAVPLPDEPEAAARVVSLFDRLAQARAAMSTRKLAAGEALVSEVMQATESLDYRPLLAEALAVRGELEDHQGRYEASLASFTEALWLADADRDDDLEADAMAMAIMAQGIRLAQFDAALRWRRHAHALIARLGEGSPGHTRLLRAFGGVLSVQGRDADAAEIMREALRLDRARAEPDDRAIVLDLKGLGTAEAMRGNYVESRAHLEEALALLERIDGPGHPDIAGIANNLAGTLVDMGEADQAMALYERALAIAEQALGPDHPEVSPALANVGSMYGERGQLERARPLLERSLAIDERVLGPEHPELAFALHSLALLELDSDDVAAARRHSQRALAIRERHFAADSKLVAISRAELATVEVAEGKFAAAVRRLEQALAVFAADREARPETLPQMRFTLARALQGAGKRERARATAKQALDEYAAIDRVRNAEAIAEIEAFLAGTR